MQLSEDGAITFAGDVPEGSLVQATTASTADVLEAAELSLRAAKDDFGDRAPAAAVVISCAARKQLLGTNTQKEYELLKQHVGDVPVIGFYSYGEIAPLCGRNTASFHNETMVTVLLGTG